jgi:hypothetical protein
LLLLYIITENVTNTLLPKMVAVNFSFCYYFGISLVWDNQSLKAPNASTDCIVLYYKLLNLIKPIDHGWQRNKDFQPMPCEEPWQKTHDQEVLGSKPPLWRHFFRHYSFGSKLGTKKLWNTLTWHCCMCCNPANGRVGLEDWSAYKDPATE